MAVMTSSATINGTNMIGRFPRSVRGRSSLARSAAQLGILPGNNSPGRKHWRRWRRRRAIPKGVKSDRRRESQPAWPTVTHPLFLFHDAEKGTFLFLSTTLTKFLSSFFSLEIDSQRQLLVNPLANLSVPHPRSVPRL